MTHKSAAQILEIRPVRCCFAAWLQAAHPATGGRNSNRAGRIVSVSDGHDARGNGGSRSARRPAWTVTQIERIARDRPDMRFGRCRLPEFRRRRHAYDVQACEAKPCGDLVISAGRTDPTNHRPRTRDGRESVHVDPKVLHQKGHAGKGPTFGRKGVKLGVDVSGGLPRSIRVDEADCSELTGL